MNILDQKEKGCCGTEKSCGPEAPLQGLQILPVPKVDDEPCCGPPAGPESSPLERPGYMLWHFVEGLINTPAGPVPKVKTVLERPDHLGTARARFGYKRNQYTIAPGLYGVGTPGPESPILVTANYKLSFDSLRKELTGLDSWILVIDTRGINVWCAAGKGTFATSEIARRVRNTNLEKIVNHRELILPQLGAPGVSAHLLKKNCGFKGIWGPIRASDIKAFLNSGKKAPPSMRTATFSMLERLVLVPVEISLIIRPTLWIFLAFFILSGISPDIFSITAAWQRSLMVVAAYIAGVFAGAVAAPALLPWIPSRIFALKGIIIGLLAGAGITAMYWDAIGVLESLTLLLCATAVSSYAAMNFTGATPFTSPSGVEKEMRRFIPVQAVAVVVAAITWIIAPFTT